MNRDETIAIMGVLKTAYPQYYSKMKREEAENAIALWSELFSHDSIESVTAAVKEFIVSDDKGFPPVIGQIKGIIEKIEKNKMWNELIDNLEPLKFEPQIKQEALPEPKPESKYVSSVTDYEQAVKISAQYFPEFNPKQKYTPMEKEEFEKKRAEILNELNINAAGV